MYCVFLKFPDALRPAFPRLKEKLEDPDPGVQAAAVNVITELARHNPKNYLNMAPIFFKLMTDSTNNWMLIKIIKLFGALCPLEPRLGIVICTYVALERRYRDLYSMISIVYSKWVALL